MDGVQFIDALENRDKYVSNDQFTSISIEIYLIKNLLKRADDS